MGELTPEEIKKAWIPLNQIKEPKDMVLIEGTAIAKAQLAKSQDFSGKDIKFIKETLTNLVKDVREKDYEGDYFSEYEIKEEVITDLLKYFVPDISHKEWAEQNGYVKLAQDVCPGTLKCPEIDALGELNFIDETAWNIAVNDYCDKCPTCQGKKLDRPDRGNKS